RLLSRTLPGQMQPEDRGETVGDGAGEQALVAHQVPGELDEAVQDPTQVEAPGAPSAAQEAAGCQPAGSEGCQQADPGEEEQLLHATIVVLRCVPLCASHLLIGRTKAESPP